MRLTNTDAVIIRQIEVRLSALDRWGKMDFQQTDDYIRMNKQRKELTHKYSAICDTWWELLQRANGYYDRLSDEMEETIKEVISK